MLTQRSEEVYSTSILVLVKIHLRKDAGRWSRAHPVERGQNLYTELPQGIDDHQSEAR